MDNIPVIIYHGHNEFSFWKSCIPFHYSTKIVKHFAFKTKTTKRSSRVERNSDIICSSLLVNPLNSRLVFSSGRAEQES